MRTTLAIATLIFLPVPLLAQDDKPYDAGLKTVLIDSDKGEYFLSVRADTMGRLFVGSRESLFVYEPNAQGGYHPRKLVYRFPLDSFLNDVEVRGNDLYVLTCSELYIIPDGVRKRINLHHPDPECRLRHVPNQAELHRVHVTASNSFGFGGSNTCLILKAA